MPIFLERFKKVDPTRSQEKSNKQNVKDHLQHEIPSRSIPIISHRDIHVYIPSSRPSWIMFSICVMLYSFLRY